MENLKNNKTELLAPAKNKEIAFAAIDCGADAIYIGATSFGARKNAPNSLEDIREVVLYAHKFWAKVFVTVNTILTDKELEEAVELVKQLDKIGVDAVIVQDMGLIEKLKNIKDCKIPIHISTQAGCIHVTASAKEDIKLYGADGKLLKSQNGTEVIFNVPSGMYIIKAGNETQKVTMGK